MNSKINKLKDNKPKIVTGNYKLPTTKVKAIKITKKPVDNDNS